jgi:hypothetical protein
MIEDATTGIEYDRSRVRSGEFRDAVGAYDRQELVQLLVDLEHTCCVRIIDRLWWRHVMEQVDGIDAPSRAHASGESRLLVTR